jgi:hypothetical protein
VAEEFDSHPAHRDFGITDPRLELVEPVFGLVGLRHGVGVGVGVGQNGSDDVPDLSLDVVGVEVGQWQRCSARQRLLGQT